MTNPLRPFLLKQIEHEFLVANVSSVNLEGVRMIARRFNERHETGEIGLLDTDIVVIVHFVDNHNVISAGEESLGDIGPYEARPPRH
jgi:hypothetical protein